MSDVLVITALWWANYVMAVAFAVFVRAWRERPAVTQDDEGRWRAARSTRR